MNKHTVGALCFTNTNSGYFSNSVHYSEKGSRAYLTRQKSGKRLVSTAGFLQALEIMENLENHEKKVPCMEKSWNLKKSL